MYLGPNIAAVATDMKQVRLFSGYDQVKGDYDILYSVSYKDVSFKFHIHFPFGTVNLISFFPILTSISPSPFSSSLKSSVGKFFGFMAEMIMPYYNTIEISQEEYDRLKSLEKLVSEIGFDDGLVKEDASDDEHGLSKTEDLD